MYHYAGNNPVRYVDPDGRVNRYGPDLNFLPECETIRQWANKEIRPDDIFVVAGHGDPTGIYEYNNPITDENGNTIRGIPTYIDPNVLAEMIKSSPRYREGMTIELWACNTGNTQYISECYAQKLANAMGEGTVVRAPNSSIWFYRRNQRRLFFSTRIYDNGRMVSIEDRTRPGAMINFIGE